MGEYNLRDHDYFETSEGLVFCVLGDVHPPGRVWSFLKYVPGEGPWRRGDVSYRRVLGIYSVDELVASLAWLKNVNSSYVFFDETVGAEVIAPPLESVSRSYSAKEVMEKILKGERRGTLEDKALELCKHLADASGVSEELFGVTGSLLLSIHHPDSDIDLLVYGLKNSRAVYEYLETRDDVSATKPLRYCNYTPWVERALKKYPLSTEDAKKLSLRVINKGTFNGVWFSVHAVRERPPHRYGEFVFKGLSLVKTILTIADNEESLCTPCVYLVEEDNELNVDRIVCYDMMLAGIFRPGDKVEVCGKLESVISSGKEVRRQILIGSYEGRGREYIRLLEPS